MERAHRTRPAFSLVELLVTIAILAALIAVLLPGVQAARGASRRTTCQNNLRQLGISLLLHHDARGAFPPGGIEWRPPGNKTKRQLAWSVFILPFLEEQALFDQLDLNAAFDDPRNQGAASTVLPAYLCPTSIRGEQLVDGRGPCDYGAIFGERITSGNQPPKGLMVYDRAYSLKDATDGASKTLIVGEDTHWSDGQWINGRNVFDQAFAINAAPPFENDLRSDHLGGAYAVTADAAVHWLTNDLAVEILASLCTRAGQEVVGPP